MRYIWQRPAWTRFRWDSAHLLPLAAQCRFLQGRLLGQLGAVGMPLDSQARLEILTEEALKTAAIEGERLDPAVVRSSIARKLGLPYAGLVEDRHVDGLVDVLLDASERHQAPLTEERLFGWHAALFPAGRSGMYRIAVGQWRGESPMRVVSGQSGKEKVHYEAPPGERIPGEMARFIRWWAEEKNTTDGLMRAGVAHFWFVTIHPFEDGNGRIARAITDMAAAQDDRQPSRYYSLSAQIRAERNAYYDILERCQKGDGDLTGWLDWFLGCFGRAIASSDTLLSRVLDKASFWRVHAEALFSERQRKVVNRILDAGQGGFAGGLTTRKYVSIAGVSRATAFREMNQLVGLGVLKENPGRGRSASYDLDWDHFAK